MYLQLCTYWKCKFENVGHFLTHVKNKKLKFSLYFVHKKLEEFFKESKH